MLRSTTIIGLSVALGLAACGDDDDTAATTTTVATVEDDVVTVTAVDYAYEGLPASVPAGTRFDLRSDSETEIHEFVAFRLDDDETRSAAELVALPPDELLPALGPEPAAVLLAPPGAEAAIPAVGDGTLTEPGRYVIICVIPTGADPAEYLEKAATSDGPPDVAGGPPHIVNGMYADLLVE